MEKRIFGLDALRFTAILMVLVAHTLFILNKSHTSLVISAFSAVIGVELFFVLSGFLIGNIIIKMHNAQAIITFNSVKIFWIRRWFRTLPNYYLILLISLVLLGVSHKLHLMRVDHLLSYLMFLQDSFSPETNAFFGGSWSLCIEEWFYLLFPLVLFCAQFFIKEKKRSLLYAILAFLLLPLLGRIILSVYSNVGWDGGFRKMLFTRLDAIAMGVLAAFLKFYFGSFWSNNKLKMATTGIIGYCFLLTLFYYKYILAFNPVSGETADSGFFMKTFFFTSFGLSSALLIPSLFAIRTQGSNYLCRSVSSVSLTSYSIYLIHPIIMNLILGLNTRRILPNNSIVTFSLIWFISLSGSYFLYHQFEKRITEFREYFTTKKETQMSTAQLIDPLIRLSPLLHKAS